MNAFFVLSGFLITGLLVEDRAEDRPFAMLAGFYARRSLRILPAYYGFLIALVGIAFAATPVAPDFTNALRSFWTYDRDRRAEPDRGALALPSSPGRS